MAYHLFCNDTISVQVGCITIETKQAARIGNNTFLFVHRDLHLRSQAIARAFHSISNIKIVF
jgi:hypothetical protein